ncbi:MAG: hypothetical protein A4E61_00018 [Syntrophorhabdus sp. PtaB.Bin184]|nr:MAG: hypothetical protein A4E61_00018 [Syntrophorhabdus sp. PtaB.Bin184]
MARGILSTMARKKRASIFVSLSPLLPSGISLNTAWIIGFPFSDIAVSEASTSISRPSKVMCFQPKRTPPSDTAVSSIFRMRSADGCPSGCVPGDMFNGRRPISCSFAGHRSNASAASLQSTKTSPSSKNEGSTDLSKTSLKLSFNLIAVSLRSNPSSPTGSDRPPNPSSLNSSCDVIKDSPPLVSIGYRHWPPAGGGGN